ncbi:DUF4190 domain-containing protein [Cellulosimicrobium cellulans]|uniref:DUF4190 domain-containing protein n=1 Tax=Cellulosimicrobium cellulans TaxID=1710 RepID=UPI0009F431D2|nr:DUF4190 domain-containing protein [Cellulosimicrobium cellulans]
MSTPDQPDRPRDPQDPTPSGPPSYGSQQPENPQSGQPEAPRYGAQHEPQYGAPQAPQYGAGQSPQYGASQAPQYGSTPGYQAPGENPGKTMGIIGLVLSFLGCLSIVGIILSIVALNKSKKAGYGNGIAVAGIIVGAIVLIGSIIFGVVFWQGVQAVAEACEGVPSGETTTLNGVLITCP